MQLKRFIKASIELLRIIRAALYGFSLEFRYFYKAKIPFHGLPISELDQSNISVRKRTHHLERFLWHPKKYPKEQGALFAKELDDLLDNKKTTLPPKQEGWAKRISREYKRGEAGMPTFCPVLQHGVERTAAAVNTQDLMTLLKQRRSRRVFQNVPLTEEEKRLITEAAQHAPSSCNRQTIDIVFVEEPALKKFVASTIPGGFQFFDQAPAIAIFLSDARDYRYPEDRSVPFIDGATAVQNVYLLCETMDLGCCWGSYTSFGNVGQEAEVRRRLNIPDSHVIVASLAIGKSTQFVCEIPREPPESRYGTNGFRQHSNEIQ